MTKTTHFGSNRLFALSKAVLVYSDAQEAFATVHEAKPSPDGGAPYLDAGQPSDGRTLSGKVFPQPPLVFKVCGSELSVRALTENRRPRPETTLMVAPYWNCDR